MNFTDIFQALLGFFPGQIDNVLLLSIVFTLLPGFVMLSLLRRFKISPLNKWAKPFSWAFFILGLLHIFSLLGWILKPYSPNKPLELLTDLGKAICSAGSNYFFLRAGAALMRDKLGPERLKTIHNKRTLISALVLATFLVATLIPPLFMGDWKRLPDVLLSTFAVVIVGVALYRNISFRRGRLVSVIALFSTIIYGGLFLSYAFHPKIAKKGWADWINVPAQKVKAESEEEVQKKESQIETERVGAMDMFVIAMSLPVKLGLFFPAYVLVLMIAGPARIRELYEKVTEGPENFLDNNGVVLSMKEEIKADLVELYIKLPREEKDQAACYRSKALMQTGGNPEELTFDETTDFGQVLYSGQCILHRVINYPDEFPEGWEQDDSKISSVIVLPVLFHSTVVGCLKAELDNGNFTEADMQNMQRFAALLSPMIQEYREADGLNEISRRLTRLQIKAEEYKIPKGIEEITEISCEILAALATSISLEGGFYLYDNMDIEKSHDLITHRLRDLSPAKLEPVYRDGDFIYLPEKLIIAYSTKEAAGETEGAEGEQFFGRYVLKAPSTSDKNNLPTLATKPIHRRAVSNLIMEAMLNQVRGSLNEVSKKLAVSLNSLRKADESGEIESAKQDSVQHWLEIVEEVAGDAGLRWVVATHPEAKGVWLGREHELVRELEEDESRWIKKDPYKGYAELDAIGLGELNPPRSGTTHVIRLSFSEPEQQMWIGVYNPNFGKELDYLSPWSGFIHRFGKIAHTALQQILRRQERERAIVDETNRKIEQERGAVAHDMTKRVKRVTSPLWRVIETIKNLKGEQYKTAKILVDTLSRQVPRLEALLKEYEEIGKIDAASTCSMEDIVNRAIERLEGELEGCDITTTLKDGPNDLAERTVEVPLHIAKNALSELVQNAVEAPRDANAEGSCIEIWVEEIEGVILCHVTDNGVGVLPGLRQRIINYGVTSSKETGSGVGLFEYAKLLRRYGGDIKVTCYGPKPTDADPDPGCVELTRRGRKPQTTFTLCFNSSSREA